MLNNKLIIKESIQQKPKGRNLYGWGKNRLNQLGLLVCIFAVLGLANAIVVRTLLFIYSSIKGIWISSTTVYISYITESNERLFRIHLNNVFIAVINGLISCCAASQSCHRPFSSGPPPTLQPTVSETIQGCRNRRGFRF